ncbi:hypothetical protein [Rhizobium sp. 768_B6_N1_8]|uniref:hypothetical protein n=1 Tax=unclassified Rhizobium TaxID=2613769 RepID=UPI003F27E3F1
MVKMKWLIPLFVLSSSALAQEQISDHTYWRKKNTDMQAGQVVLAGDPMFVFAGKSMASEALMWFTPICGVTGFNASVAGASDQVVEDMATGVARKIKARFIVAIGIPFDDVSDIPVIHVDDATPQSETIEDIRKVIGPLSRSVHDAALKQLSCSQ